MQIISIRLLTWSANENGKKVSLAPSGQDLQIIFSLPAGGDKNIRAFKNQWKEFDFHINKAMC